MMFNFINSGNYSTFAPAKYNFILHIKTLQVEIFTIFVFLLYVKTTKKIFRHCEVRSSLNQTKPLAVDSLS